jgi:hypothetical protein
VLRKVLLSYFYVAVWIFLSFSVIVYNKYILDPKMYNWPFPISLTMVHMGFCSSLAVALVRVLRVVDLPTSPSMTPQFYTSSVVPIGALYAMSLWFSNSAYIYLSVSFIQMLKALMPVAVYSIGVLFKKETFRSSSMLNMLSISFGVAIAAYGEARFDVRGVALQLAAVAFEATRLVLIQILFPPRALGLRRAAQAARRRHLPTGFLRLWDELTLRLCAQPCRLSAGRQDLGADHERRGSSQGLAVDCLLVVRDPGHRHTDQPVRVRDRVFRGGLLQSCQAAGAQG